jgi:beta-galactosidase
MENRIYLNEDWQFTPTFSEELLDARAAALPLRTVRLPHTCKELPYHYFSEADYQMFCGYRRVLFAPEAWQGKRLLLTIDGAAHHAAVFLNGELIGEHSCGYTAFTLDLSEKLRYGRENVLAISANFALRVSDSMETLLPLGAVAEIFSSYLRSDDYKWVYQLNNSDMGGKI